MDMGRGDQKLRTGFFNLLISSCRHVINLIVLENVCPDYT